MLFVSQAYAASLYNESSYQSIVGQKIDYKIGDLLTVIIYESSTASNTALTDTSTGVDVGWTLNDGTPEINKNFNANSDFEGGGKVNRTGKIIASISVSVTEILPNGDYKINGEQNIKLNNEEQTIRVSGLVRPEDITSENSVLSTRIANANIDFKGNGLLSNTEKPGIITQFFNWLF